MVSKQVSFAVLDILKNRKDVGDRYAFLLASAHWFLPDYDYPTFSLILNIKEIVPNQFRLAFLATFLLDVRKYLILFLLFVVSLFLATT